MHISGKKKWLSKSYSHSEDLLEIFLNYLKERPSELISRDFVIITGDLTDTGSIADTDKAKKVISDLCACGIVRENILIIPGNHDAWFGDGRAGTAINSYLVNLFECSIFRKFKKYQKRKLPSIFSSYEGQPSQTKALKLNDVDINILMLNSSIPGEMARGIFPINLRSNFERKPCKKILMLHHHLLNDMHKTNLDIKNFINTTAMRVLNHKDAFSFIFENNINLTFHGHKHYQYFKREFRHNSTEDYVDIISAPSLCENKYNDRDGNYIDDNIIGFNLMIPKKSSYEYYFFRLNDWKFKLKHFDEIGW